MSLQTKKQQYDCLTIEMLEIFHAVLNHLLGNGSVKAQVTQKIWVGRTP